MPRSIISEYEKVKKFKALDKYGQLTFQRMGSGLIKSFHIYYLI